MLPPLRWLIPAILAGLLGLMTPTGGFAAGTAFRIRDEAGLFGKEAVEKANKKIAEIKRQYDRDLLIETFNHPPDDLKKEYREEGKGKFFQDWSGSRYKSEGVRGVYVLICKNPKSLYARAGEATVRKAFTQENVKTLERQLQKELGADADKALLTAVEYVETTMEKNGAKPAASSTGTGGARTPSPTTGAGTPFKNPVGSSIMGYVCIGLVALLALWMVFGLIRALTGGGRPSGGGYGPGGPVGPGGPGYGAYGGGGGGGGGGFLSSLMGGMLGAGAGNYLYDSFFRGNSSGASGWGSSASAAGTTPNQAASGPDDSNSTGGAGGDWGSNNAAGGDAGAGGDWGGGGDAGGGGDWGGGGGDAGGGGDWGGGGDAGGGGDWGGGGGDAGGGGGGDW